MAPGNGKSDFLPSSAHIYGIVVVQGVSPIPKKPRSVLLEAAFWTGQLPVLGVFRYYNGDGIVFKQHQRYFIQSSVSFTIALFISCAH